MPRFVAGNQSVSQSKLGSLRLSLLATARRLTVHGWGGDIYLETGGDMEEYYFKIN